MRTAKAPFGHWVTQTFIAGLRCGKLTAPFVINVPMDCHIFETYAEKEFAPTLAKGDIVIMDICRPERARPPGGPSRQGAPGSCPAALKSRSQSDQDGLRKAQSSSARKSHQDHRRSLARDRAHLRSLPSCRMPKLLRRRRISPEHPPL